MTTSLIGAFTAGVLTILTPCVLPMIPLYLAFLTGRSIQEQKEHAQRFNMLRLVFPFILGFTLIFVLLGASASFIGSMLLDHRDILRKVLGSLVIAFGLMYLGLLPSLKFMLKDTRLLQKIPKGGGMISSFLFGAAFALGWSPCVGPILASVLALAAIEETVAHGMLLLGLYSLGFAIPLTIIALLIDKILPLLQKANKLIPKFEIACGLVLFEVGRYLVMQ